MAKRKSKRLAAQKRSEERELANETGDENQQPVQSSAQPQPQPVPQPAADPPLLEHVTDDTVSQPDPAPDLPAADHPVQRETEPVPAFEQIDHITYLFDRPKCRLRKDIRRMVCDCILTKEERQRGIVGCGEDCLNRMLMMECGPRCPLGEHCTNKRFQKRQYPKAEPFRAGLKGWGLRVMQHVKAGDFIMEYVGEVVDPDEFRSRVKRYSRDGLVHHYFMALKSDEIIDATVRGNVTRFVNHSCEPTCETQKWTINGELRIGFFAIRDLRPGDEVTFDYQFQRYGKEAQKCHCETASCRGFIGATDSSTIDLDGSRLTAKQRSKIASIDNKLRSRKEEFEDVALEAEIEKLISSGCLKNKNQTMTLARLMVRTEETRDRVKLLDIVNNTRDPVFLRLFMDYHGLQLLWSWMVDTDDAILKASILQILSILPIPNRTVLVDSKVMEMVEKWAKEVAVADDAASNEVRLPFELPPVCVKSDLMPLPEDDTAVAESDTSPAIVKKEPESSDHKVQPDSSEEKENLVTAEPSEVLTAPLPDTSLESNAEATPIQNHTDDDQTGFQLESNESSQDSKCSALPDSEQLPDSVKTEADSGEKPKESPDIRKQPDDSLLLPQICQLAQKLLLMWKDLKEGFKIPRLVRQKRQADEIEADRRTQEYEMNRARGMPYNYNLTGKRGPEERDGIASILLGNKKFKKQNQQSPAAQWPYDMPMDVSHLQIPQEPAVPKVSKETHRMQVELAVMKQEYEEKMANYRAQIEMMAEMSKQRVPLFDPPEQLIPMPQLPPSRSSLDEPYPSTDYSEFASDYNAHLSAPTSVHELDFSPDGLHAEFDNACIEDDELNWYPDVTIDNQANVLIECSSHDNELMTDEKAVIQTDYGVEFCWFTTRDSFQPPKHLFDPIYPPPGVYYECVFADTVYFVPRFSFSPDETMAFTATEVRAVLPDASRLAQEEQAPLPQHWRRTRDKVTGHLYYYNKRTGLVQWTLPEFDSPIKLCHEKVEDKIQSVVASADSTSTPQLLPPGSSSPSNNSLSSPPGIFAITNGHHKRQDPRRAARAENEPDQSGKRKSSKGVVYATTKKGLEKFKLEVSEFVKKVLYPYRLSDCKVGRIETNDEFKLIARKLVNEVYQKEINSGKTELSVNETVKKKAKSFIKKYMSSKGSVFKVGHSPTSDPVLGNHDQDSQNADGGSLDGCMHAISDV